jgi:hypothetical protein
LALRALAARWGRPRGAARAAKHARCGAGAGWARPGCVRARRRHAAQAPGSINLTEATPAALEGPHHLYLAEDSV